jgi:hypothetical protein
VAILKAQIPHFAIPFHFHEHGDGLRAHEVEQGSGEEIQACVETLVRYTKGTRPEYPDFGVTDYTFDEQPIPVDDLKAEIIEQEPRAEIEILTNPSTYDELIAEVRLDMTSEGAAQ